MLKKLFGILFIITIVFFIFPTKAETTGNFQIIIDPITKKISILINSGNTTTGITTTGTTTITGKTTTEQTLTTTQNITIQTGLLLTGTEFQQALNWMYTNGLTKYNNEIDYRANDTLTREEAAKIIGQAFITLGYQQTIKNTNCTFIDANQIDPSLSNFVVNTCKRGIFKGSTDNRFMPTQKLTRPQAMALLIRIFEGKLSNEQRIPRWGDYYIKAQALGLTTLTNQNAFDQEISRKEIAIYIYRLKNIITNEYLKITMLNKITELNTNQEEKKNTTGILNNFGSLANSLNINNDPELLEAIRWMNDNKLTNFKTINEYKPFEILNREQAAKILTMFANIFKFTTNTGGILPTECIFKDISDADASLMTYIEQACKIGIMKGSNKYFTPKGTINKAQFISAIIRLFEGKKFDENLSPRWKNYFEKAQEIGMIGPADAITFENPITRYEVALFLYRFKIKHQILQNMNNNTIQNQMVSTVPGSITTGTNNMLTSNVYVDINLLKNGNFDVGYLEIFNKRYKLVKSNTEKYFTNNFVRYGDIFSLEKEEKIGTSSFIVSNLSLIEGTIRIQESTYVITPITNTNAYYKITQTK